VAEADQVAAYLADARERAEQVTVVCEPGCGGEPCTGHDALCLLAAFEAALAELVKHQHTITDKYGTICAGCLYGVPCPSTAVIASALLGKEPAAPAPGSDQPAGMDPAEAAIRADERERCAFRLRSVFPGDFLERHGLKAGAGAARVLAAAAAEIEGVPAGDEDG
jgi:hypothetical protein